MLVVKYIDSDDSIIYSIDDFYKDNNTTRKKFSERSKGSRNPNAKHVGLFFNSELIYEYKGNQKDFCDIHGCSSDAIQKSIKNKEMMYPSRHNHLFHGYIAKYIITTLKMVNGN